MHSPSLVSLSAVVAALALLIPASEAVLPLALPALSASAASAIIGLSTLALVKAWMPDGYSQIFRSYVFGPSGFWTMAPLRCKI